MSVAGERIIVKVDRGTSGIVMVNREPGLERKWVERKKLKLILFKCDEPNRKYPTNIKLNLYQHAAVHSDEKRHKCLKCEKTFKRINYLKYHLELHSDETPFQCDKCEYSCKYKRYLTYHLLKHSAMEPWRCDQPNCQYTTRVKADLKQHKNGVHESKKRFKCDECQRAFKTKKWLKRHSFVHSRIKPFKCQKCQYSSIQKRDLQRHEQARHVYEKDRKCDECGASFHLTDDLEKHKLNHIDALKKFKCHLCPYKTIKKDYLSSHSLSHRNKGCYKCDECDRSFNRAPHLKRHRFTHSKIKNVSCDECDYRTNNPSNLRQHQLVTLHSISNARRGDKCVQCGLTMNHKSDSAIHRDAHRPCSVALPRLPHSGEVNVYINATPLLRRVKIELNDDIIKKEIV